MGRMGRMGRMGEMGRMREIGRMGFNLLRMLEYRFIQAGDNARRDNRGWAR